ncbi:MAG: ferritin-like domain-containing protein [Planctomycetes bacterium]|nr:ferritin-like domain-containing protein [Planctomycetota bacterium]
MWSSEEWVAYFGANAKRLLNIPWELEAGLTPEELAMVAASLPAWQLGETSDGAHLFAAARKYAEANNDPAFVEAVRLFIHEEHRHGSQLGRFLDLAGIPRRTWYWGDTLFRQFRRLFTRIEMSASIVVMVEIHALLYYGAIRRGTGSLVLRRVCQQILRDEIPHIRFQCERLAMLHRRRPRILRMLTLLSHRMMFAGITLAIWVGHRRALHAGGFTFGRFWRTAWSKMGHTWRTMDPRAYRWPEAELRPVAE